MLDKVVYSLVLGVFLQYCVYYRDWLNWDRNLVKRVAPGPCKYALTEDGSEDVVHIGDGIFIISAGFNWDGDTGYVKTIDTRGDTPIATTLNISGMPVRTDFLAAPHGITTWKDPKSGELILYVLTHPSKEDRIEVFEVSTRGSIELRYIKTITDPSFTFMNDLVAVDRDKFYITRYTLYRDSRSVQLEHLSHLRTGKIFYYNGHKAREVAAGFFLPNGINASPDLRFVYMAEWGKKMLNAFRRESSGGLTLLWSEFMDTGVDNIEVDPDTGDLWIGCHPVTWRIVDFLNLFGTVPPSQVIRVKLRDNAVWEIEEIYADNGEELSGTTAASYARGKLVIGTVTKETLVCDVKYLSP